MALPGEPRSGEPRSGEPKPDPQAHLERCWLKECDIDPMILRMRLLRHQGSLPQAHCLEQELMPLF